MTAIAAYTEFQPKLYTYIYRRTGDPHLAEDLTAQCFLKAIEAERSGKGSHSSFSGWLYRIAHNAVIDFYRQRDRQPQVSLDDMPRLPSGHNPVREAIGILDSELLHRAMQRLTTEQALVIRMRYLEGYSFDEIAECMGKTQGAVKALRHRAVVGLRNQLREAMR